MSELLPAAPAPQPCAVHALHPDGTVLTTDPDGSMWLRKYRGGVQRAAFVVEDVDVESLRRWVK